MAGPKLRVLNGGRAQPAKSKPAPKQRTKPAPKRRTKPAIDPRARLKGRIFEIIGANPDGSVCEIRVTLARSGGIKANTVTVAGCAFLVGQMRVLDRDKWLPPMFGMAALDTVLLIQEVDAYQHATETEG